MLPAIFPSFLKNLYDSVTPVIVSAMFLLPLGCLYTHFAPVCKVLPFSYAYSHHLYTNTLLTSYYCFLFTWLPGWNFLWHLSELNCLLGCPSYLESSKLWTLHVEEKMQIRSVFLINDHTQSLAEMSPLFLMSLGSNSLYLCSCP